MTTDRITDARLIRAMIARQKLWYQQIELAPGIMTPGIVTPGIDATSNLLGFLDAIGLPGDCHGLRVLDIGCRDGFFSFEMERRGADVTGVDYAKPEETGFPIAARILGSKVPYRVRNVYNLNPAEDGLYDIVLFLGVFYHLRNPLLALDHIRSVLKVGGLLFLSTHLSTNAKVLKLDVPVLQFLPRDTFHGDPSNKWVPNLSGLRLCIEESQCKVLDIQAREHVGVVRAQAVTDEQLEYFRMMDSSEGVWAIGEQPPASAPPGVESD